MEKFDFSELREMSRMLMVRGLDLIDDIQKEYDLNDEKLKQQQDLRKKIIALASQEENNE